MLLANRQDSLLNCTPDSRATSLLRSDERKLIINVDFSLFPSFTQLEPGGGLYTHHCRLPLFAPPTPFIRSPGSSVYPSVLGPRTVPVVQQAPSIHPSTQLGLVPAPSKSQIQKGFILFGSGKTLERYPGRTILLTLVAISNIITSSPAHPRNCKSLTCLHSFLSRPLGARPQTTDVIFDTFPFPPPPEAKYPLTPQTIPASTFSST